MRLIKYSSCLLLSFALPFIATAAEPKITQDDLGILHGDFVKVDKPISSADLGTIQIVKSIWVTPDSQRVLIHEWRTDEQQKKVDRLLLLDAATAKVERVLTEKHGRWLDQRTVQIAPDNKSVFTRNPKAFGVIQISLDTGEITRTIPSDHPYTSLQFSSDVTLQRR